MRFHVLALPFVPVSKEYSADAYNSKCRNFSRMMSSLGHEVITYASEGSEVDGELAQILSREEQRVLYGEYDYKKEFFKIEWDPTHPHWTVPNSRIIGELNRRLQPRDFICVIGGRCHQPVTQNFPEAISVEFGIGYKGVFSAYKVFESHAWMHYVYGMQGDDNGKFYDTVIPPYTDPGEFRIGKPDYHLFLGRLIDRKGWRIAVEATERLGANLKMAGQIGDTLPDLPAHVEHVGYVDVEERKELLANAAVLWVPTTYLEPGGNVHIEGMMSGVPVIAPNFGIFPETVRDGLSGYRFATLGEAVRGARDASELDRERIREYAVANFSLDVISKKYELYFQQLETLWEEGFYTEWEGSSDRYSRVTSLSKNTFP